MQGGRYRGLINDEVAFSIVFPKAFPNQVLAVGAIPFISTANNERDLWLQNMGEPSLNGASFFTQAGTSNDQSLNGFDWWAWGR